MKTTVKVLDAYMYREQNGERSAYNMAKREILETVAQLGTATAWQIGFITSRTPESASMGLYRYHLQGLLSRRTISGKTKGYELTNRGRERLEWLTRSPSTRNRGYG